ncbi:hypothetical protein niasHT_023045 [Heterodera trifolii]|uniref:Uncharacterized protein n=1 Tax=Heterodera trifolii TaxID=157864 RepID=A0ABD2KF02_9BILA
MHFLFLSVFSLFLAKHCSNAIPIGADNQRDELRSMVIDLLNANQEFDQLRSQLLTAPANDLNAEDRMEDILEMVNLYNLRKNHYNNQDKDNGSHNQDRDKDREKDNNIQDKDNNIQDKDSNIQDKDSNIQDKDSNVPCFHLLRIMSSFCRMNVN